MAQTPLIDELYEYARDQLKTIRGWHGEHYVERCLQLWATEYGDAVAAKVRARLNAD